MRKLIVLGIFTALASGLANAGSVSSVINNPGGLQLWSDNSAESLFKPGGGESTILEVGDILFGQFTIETVEFGGGFETGLGSTSGNNELTGVFAAQVFSKVDLGDLGQVFDFVFAPVDAANKALLAAQFPTIGAEFLSWDDRSLAAFYEDPSNDYTRLGSDIEATFATANSGSKLFEAGFLGETGEGWFARTFTDDVDVVGTGVAGGIFNLGVNVIPGTLSVPWNFNKVNSPVFGGIADIVGSGSLIGNTGFTTPYDVFNNVDFTVDVSVVPEPGSVAVWSLLSIVGVVGYGRRRFVKRCMSNDA